MHFSPARWVAGPMIASSTARLGTVLSANTAATGRALAKKAGITFMFAVLALLAWNSPGDAGEPGYSPIRGLLTYGREPNDLPPRFRTNCSIQNGRFYCAYRCGFSYEFFYCSSSSFGCCHIADGYCDYKGYLRCRP